MTRDINDEKLRRIEALQELMEDTSLALFEADIQLHYAEAYFPRLARLYSLFKEPKDAVTALRSIEELQQTRHRLEVEIITERNNQKVFGRELVRLLNWRAP